MVRSIWTLPTDSSFLQEAPKNRTQRRCTYRGATSTRMLHFDLQYVPLFCGSGFLSSWGLHIVSNLNPRMRPVVLSNPHTRREAPSFTLVARHLSSDALQPRGSHSESICFQGSNGDVSGRWQVQSRPDKFPTKFVPLWYTYYIVKHIPTETLVRLISQTFVVPHIPSSYSDFVRPACSQDNPS